MADFLKALNITADNAGCSTGSAWWSSNQQGKTLISDNPTQAKEIARVKSASAADYQHIVKTATEAFVSWRSVPAPQRGLVIKAIGDAVEQKKNELASLVSLEMGKSFQEGLGEVQEVIDMADFAVGQSRMLYGKTMPSERKAHRMYEQWHPLGVVGVMSAFNFPIAVWSWNAFLAAIAGNTVVWKPSPKTPLCAIAMQHICNEVLAAMNYHGIFSLFITDELNLAQLMVNDSRIALLSFTGSSSVGREINQAVAGRFGKVLLELSGNNAVIVDEQADLKLALPAIVFGAIGTAGQRCTTIRRLFIHEAIYDPCLKALVTAYQSIKIGDPLDSQNLMGPLIDEQSVDAFEAAVRECCAAGGKILHGGKRINRPGYFVEPTLMLAENHWEVVQRETFAPILYVMKYRDLDEAIRMQNHSRFGLASALFSNDLSHAELFLSERGSDCGIANINLGTSGAEIGGAFGGEKETGGGREAGTDAWQAYMRRQTCTINWSQAVRLAQGIRFEIS